MLTQVQRFFVWLICCEILQMMRRLISEIILPRACFFEVCKFIVGFERRTCCRAAELETFEGTYANEPSVDQAGVVSKSKTCTQCACLLKNGHLSSDLSA